MGIFDTRISWHVYILKWVFCIRIFLYMCIWVFFVRVFSAKMFLIRVFRDMCIFWNGYFCIRVFSRQAYPKIQTPSRASSCQPRSVRSTRGGMPGMSRPHRRRLAAAHVRRVTPLRPRLVHNARRGFCQRPVLFARFLASSTRPLHTHGARIARARQRSFCRAHAVFALVSAVFGDFVFFSSRMCLAH
jgi:hypothetical protein